MGELLFGGVLMVELLLVELSPFEMSYYRHGYTLASLMNEEFHCLANL